MACGPCAKAGGYLSLAVFVPCLILAIVVGNLQNGNNASATLAVEIIGFLFVGGLVWAIAWSCIGIDVYRTWPFSSFWSRWTFRPCGVGWRISG